MSYIIAPSSQKEYELVDSFAQGTTLENPASYNNHFSNPIRIKKNSQVALLNAKINRVDTFDVQDDNGYYVYIGKELEIATDNSLRNRASIPVPFVLTRDFHSSSSISEIELQEHSAKLQQTPSEMLKTLDLNQRQLWHPEFRGLGSATFEIQTGGASNARDFNGFKFNFDQYNNGSNASYLNSSFAPTHPNTKFSGSNASTAKVETNTSGAKNFPAITRLAEDGDDFDCTAMGYEYPLAVSGGSATFHIGENASGGGFQVGLTRPKRLYNEAPSTYKNTQKGLKQYPPHFTQTGNFFFDWAVRVEEFPTTAGRNIEVLQSVVKGSEFRIEEVEYWNSTSANTDFHALDSNLEWNNASYSDIKFTAIGERMLIEIYDKVEEAWKKLADSSDPSQWPKTTKSISQNNVYMYPIVDISVQNASLGLVQYNGRKTYSETPSIARNAITYNKANFYSACLKGTLLMSIGIEAIRAVDFRDIFKTAFSQSSASLVGLNASGGVAYSVAMILEHAQAKNNTRYMENRYNPFAKVFGAHATDYLGFSPMSEIQRSRNGDNTEPSQTSIFHMASTSAPTPYSRSNTFIRINDLPIESYNGAQSGISKIVGTVPRFDSTNNEVGSLFYDIANPVYLDLNNTEDILLNQMKIDFVNVDEKIVNDLTGTSVVTLHIRQKPSL
jgi:hypothetical protein